MYIHRYLSSLALLVILVISVISVGCSNEAAREYRELMERGEASQTEGQVYEAAEAFLSASKIQGSERKLNAAIQAFERTRSALNEEEYESLLAEFREWLASQPTASAERYLFIDAGNPAAKDIRAEVAQSLRQKLGTGTWEEELLLEIKIAGVKVESIEISTMTRTKGPSHNRTYKTMNIIVQMEGGSRDMTDQQRQAVRNVMVEAYRRPPVPPKVDLVLYLRTNPDEGVSFVEIVRFRDAE